MAVTAKRYTWNEISADQPMAEASRKRVIGERMMLSRLELDKGCVVPTHAHENEQICCVLSGRIRFVIGEADQPNNENIIVGPGDVLHLPSFLPHAAFIEEDTVVLDLFSPPSQTTGIDQQNRQSA